MNFRGFLTAKHFLQVFEFYRSFFGEFCNRLCKKRKKTTQHFPNKRLLSTILSREIALIYSDNAFTSPVLLSNSMISTNLQLKPEIPTCINQAYQMLISWRKSLYHVFFLLADTSEMPLLLLNSVDLLSFIAAHLKFQYLLISIDLFNIGGFRVF